MYERLKRKASPLQAWTDPEGSRRFRLTRVKSITKGLKIFKNNNFLFFKGFIYKYQVQYFH